MVTSSARRRRILAAAGLLCVAAALASAAVAVVSPWVRRELAIDSCLDAGGRWDYVAETCITSAAADR